MYSIQSVFCRYLVRLYKFIFSWMANASSSGQDRLRHPSSALDWRTAISVLLSQSTTKFRFARQAVAIPSALPAWSSLAYPSRPALRPSAPSLRPRPSHVLLASVISSPAQRSSRSSSYREMTRCRSRDASPGM